MLKDIIQSLDYISDLCFDEKVVALNAIRKRLHELSPFKSCPVDFVEWVKNENVHANDYNPNSVAPPRNETIRAID